MTQRLSVPSHPIGIRVLPTLWCPWARRRSIPSVSEISDGIEPADHTWQNMNRIFAVQGPDVAIVAARRWVLAHIRRDRCVAVTGGDFRR
jgi:hypothetical protein